MSPEIWPKSPRTPIPSAGFAAALLQLLIGQDLQESGDGSGQVVSKACGLKWLKAKMSEHF